MTTVAVPMLLASLLAAQLPSEPRGSVVRRIAKKPPHAQLQQLPPKSEGAIDSTPEPTRSPAAETQVSSFEARSPASEHLPDTSRPGPPLVLPVGPTRDDIAAGSSLGPWIALGSSIVVGAIGAYFAGRTASVLSTRSYGIDTGTLITGGGVAALEEEIERQQASAFKNGLTATVLLSASVAGLVTSTILLASE